MAEAKSHFNSHLLIPSPRIDPKRAQTALEKTLKSPTLFTGVVLILSYLYPWALHWTLSSAPLLQLLILIGEASHQRVLPTFHLWPLFTTLHLVYAICSTSWLLYWVFTVTSYGLVMLVSVWQSDRVARFVRRLARSLLKQLHFIDDKVAFFDIPALEIDTDVAGLMVLRGITFSLSTLSFVVHGVEVGIKLSDDMELAIGTERVEVRLFRGIEVGDCFANLKGGEYEMTFGKLEGKHEDVNGDQVFLEGTPLLKAAALESDRRSIDSVREEKIPRRMKMTQRMTSGQPPQDSSAADGLDGMSQVNPSGDSDDDGRRYKEMINFLTLTNGIYEARQHVYKVQEQSEEDELNYTTDDLNAVRAAICSYLHGRPSVPHPPARSIKVTTLQNLSPPYIRRFLHRLPMLLRLLLNPLAYFHPVKIASITATASGAWINSMLGSKVFFLDEEGEGDELSSLQKRISSWLSDANFAIEFGTVEGLAQVPFIPSYDIMCSLNFNDVMAYRSLPAKTDLKQVIRLGGADAGFIIPSFLLPHHEHLLPEVPSKEHKAGLEDKIDEADGKPKELQAERMLEQAEKDEANVKVSVHAKLPACFDQELLDWVAALVKATKVVELEKADSAMDAEVHNVKQFASALKGGFKEGVKKVVVDGVVNERWIAKVVGKITKKLEQAQGEVGYTGNVPVALDLYRTAYLETEGEKILP